MTQKAGFSLLNIGTKILQRDSMDQFVRTLGDYKTYYASTLQAAIRSLKEHQIQIMITEVDYSDGTAFRLLKEMMWNPDSSNVYVILAIEETRNDLIAFATELEVNAVLVKPFSAVDLKKHFESYQAHLARKKEVWETKIFEAKAAFIERRYTDAERLLLDSVKAAPKLHLPAYRAGKYFLEKNDFAVAEKFLKISHQNKPDFVPTIHHLAVAHAKKREFEKAIEMFKKAQAISPLNPDRLYEIARLQVMWAVELCKGSIRIDPSAIESRLLLGKLNSVDKDYVGTVRELEGHLNELSEAQRLEVQTFLALARKLGGLAK